MQKRLIMSDDLIIQTELGLFIISNKEIYSNFFIRFFQQQKTVCSRSSRLNTWQRDDVIVFRVLCSCCHSRTPPAGITTHTLIKPQVNIHTSSSGILSASCSSVVFVGNTLLWSFETRPRAFKPQTGRHSRGAEYQPPHTGSVSAGSESS